MWKHLFIGRAYIFNLVHLTKYNILCIPFENKLRRRLASCVMQGHKNN